ncbi:hypothetical protein [Cupriavidus sp. BIC8F]|uniref:hypothetical protein n=1 Tax=Cupriavidus sp. BIC8F TaxID=3079014 RepID=UPI002916190E|nr:hypothetical protein [Cupriavidus sp. BIC8F]
MDDQPINERERRIPEKVAVIAVHGVGAPKFGETARRLVTLLQRHGCQPNANDSYSTFDETVVEIPVRRRHLGGTPNASPTVDVEFSLKAIDRLDKCDALAHYRTIRLAGTRTAQNGTKTAIDMFEMRWADLSSGPRVWSRFVVELYQVFFHLASLGRKTAISAAESSECERSRVLRWSATAHRCVECLLPTAIPIANLFFLAPALALIVLWIPASLAPWIAPALGAVVMLAIGLWISFSARAAPAMMLVLPVAGAVGVAIFRVRESAVGLGYAAMGLGIWFAWVASRWLLFRYSDRVRSRAASAGLLATVFLFGVAAFQPDASPAEEAGMIGVAMWMAAAIFLVLQMFWLLLFLLLAAICVLSLAGGVVRLGAREMRALRTGRLGVLTSTTLFFLTTVLLWASVLAQILDKDRISKVIDFKHNFPLLLYVPSPAVCHPGCSVNLYTFIETLYAATVGMHANLFLVLIGITLLLAASSVMPSAWFETKPPRANQAGQPLEGRLRYWLDSAGAMLWPAEIVLVISIVALASGYPYMLGAPADRDWLRSAGVLLAAAVPVSILLRARLPKAAAAILDIALDVSNWLKERPFASNPRGRIMCRYIALLKEINKERAYDRIVIVAHSQGTIISADLFRMLQQTRQWPFPTGQMPRIDLLTAGCPLRQLYLSRFPIWYGWAADADYQSLGVSRWINVYRTGDYVGRDLWTAAATSLSKNCTTADISIGGGAHTHYFDETAPEVGRIIDWMIST